MLAYISPLYILENNALTTNKVCDITQKAVKKNKCKKAKWFSGEALQIAEKRREAKVKGEKER